MTPKRAYYDHKKSAAKRGVAFQFTFEEWIAWWQLHLGANWMMYRGRRVNDYVMARNGDVGPYHPDNVMCLTVSQNHIQRKNKYHKLRPEQALEIFQMKGTQKAIAAQYGVSERLVRLIKAKQIYKHIL